MMKKLAMAMTAFAAALVCFAAFGVAPKAAGRGESAALTFSTTSQYAETKLVGVQITFDADVLQLNEAGSGETDTAWLLGEQMATDSSTISGTLNAFDLEKNTGVLLFIDSAETVTGDLCRLNFTVKDDASYGDTTVTAVFTFQKGDNTVVGTETITRTLTVESGNKVFEYGMSASLNLESIISINVNYSLTDMKNINPENFGLLVWDNDDPVTEAEMTYENCERIYANAHVAYSNASRYETTTDGIDAKMLGDALKFRAYYKNENGEYSYSRVVTNYSPKAYCTRRITNSSDETEKALMYAILNYGTAAQKYFDYKTDTLMNADLSDENKALNWDGSLVRSSYNVPDGKDSGLTRTTGVARNGALNLVGEIDYIFSSKAASGFEATKATVYYWKESQFSSIDSMTLENAFSSEEMVWDASYGGYRAYFENQPAKEMFETVFAYVVLENASGEKQYSGVFGYSPERFSYINQNSADANTAELARRIALYGDAARTYFN